MAVDLEAIRKRVLELSGQRKNSQVQLWKPTVGNYKVRGLPWPKPPEGMPFIERRFYYVGDQPRILAPSQFQKPDPINDLLRKLFSSGKKEDRELAKKLMPKMTAYMPIVVRGACDSDFNLVDNQESKGVLVYSFNKFLYQRLLGFFTDTEVGDILDPLQGFDLKVTIKPSGKKFNGKEVMDTVIDACRSPSVLSKDTEQAKKWLEGVPNIDDMYPQKTASEIEKVLNDWLAGGGAADDSDGSSRGEKPQDALDQIVEEVKAEVKSNTKPVEAKAETNGKAKRGKKADVDLDSEAPVKKSSLDEAFEELSRPDSE
jgi:hypothetical protein